MDVGRRRSGGKSSVVAGSVWESRMKSDEVKGGIKVYNGEESSSKIEENNNSSNGGGGGESRRIVKKGQPRNLVPVSGKRKTWKSESFDGPIIQIAAGAGKDLSVDSVDGGIKKSSGLNKKGRPEEENERREIQTRKTRSVDSCSNKEIVVHSGVQLRKSKSESVKSVDETGNGIEKKSSAVQLRKVKSELSKGYDDESNEGYEKIPDENLVIGSEENCKEFDVCEEKVISSEFTNVGLNLISKSPPEVLPNDEDDVVDEDFDEEEEEEFEEIEKEEIKINLPEQKQKQSPEKIVVNEVKKIDLPEKKQKQSSEKIVVNEVKKIDLPEQKQKQSSEKIVVNEVKKFNQFHDKSAPISSTVNKQSPPVVKRTTIYSNFTKPTRSSVSDDFQSFPETQNKLQNLVDLVMWRDVSKSAFVFGIGTFIIISSSYTTDLNISIISVISYLGLVYLAAIFLYRAIICRGVIDKDGSNYVLGEEEAIWLLKLILPYLNEFLLKLKALFSGDPATTMKLAVLLFVLARCGSSITIWKMAKLGFFGVFVLPKVCSSYSTQLAGYGKFWIRRFRDAWDSCSHKKAVTVAIFTLVWNQSSIVARTWAVFMLFVAVRYYQQSMMKDDWVEDDTEEGKEETWSGPQNREQKEAYKPNRDGLIPNRLRPTVGQQMKPKKLS